MVKLEPIKKIIKYTLASGKLEDERPLSLIIIAPVECAKTSLIRRYCLNNENVLYRTDATAHGIVQDTHELKDFMSGGYTHIAIPDLLKCIGRKQETVRNFISFMNALTEEGVSGISTYASHIGSNKEVKCGLITAIPPDPFFDKRHNWGRMGFLSRALPVTYKYKPSTQAEILSYIQKQEHLKEGTVRLKQIPEESRVIKLDAELAKQIEPFAKSLAEEYSKYQKVYGFRYQRQLQTLVKAIALFKGKDEVDEECLDELQELSNHINFEFNRI